MTTLLISKIQIIDRYRQDFGDIPGLAASIKTNGLMSPVIVDEQYRLIDGERRIRATQHLGHDWIDVRVVNVPSLLVAEHDANAFAKQWTPSEKLAIAKAIEAEVKAQAKARQADAGGDKKSVAAKEKIASGQLARSDQQAPSRDTIALKAGFNSVGSYRRAKQTQEHGIPEVIDAMDQNVISIHKAAEIAKLPQDQQPQALAEAQTPANPPTRRRGRPAGSTKPKPESKPKPDESRLYAPTSPVSALMVYRTIEKYINNLAKKDPNTGDVLHKIINLCNEKLIRIAN